ncbi:ribosomal-protein-alanine N-acetyltransferase [Sporanaerobium hydrogeniformans]|uniref:Ribosomal-protein-alanine N-acetyltransferase n=1 Tax=Sporanaerobium hydrogeniformans TaxID=3072179 RepID=A0AC61DGN0_9FIRM|nr:ribosomal protein S18-alanine N-acetyltransferase [Sporanaerobium hydrogeniformans]PHV72025.1 ribosomal-protein-alanine N-acetyltransferase [Sporanaerobium hydrogeniformans]
MKPRPMLFKDLPLVYAIECESFSTPWSLEALKEEMCNSLAYYVVVEKEGQVVGYGGLWVVEGEGEIINIGVRKAYRGQGIGKSILEELIAYGQQKGACQMTLEVRESNEVARYMYTSFGFQVIGKRKGYYNAPKEDALMMQLQL